MSDADTMPQGPGILTYSGRFIQPTEGEIPSLVDIAVSLSRQPRFGGHCREHWTVLDHSFFVERLARAHTIAGEYTPPLARALRLAALLHDAHEGVTADVPTPFKDLKLRTLQGSLDERLMDAYFPGGYSTFQALAHTIHDCDRRALLAEARVVGPPSLNTDDSVKHYFGDTPRMKDIRQLQEYALWRTQFGTSRGANDAVANEPLVKAFLGLVVELR